MKNFLWVVYNTKLEKQLLTYISVVFDLGKPPSEFSFPSTAELGTLPPEEDVVDGFCQVVL